MAKDETVQYGALIREAREGRMTQGELAKEVGTTQQTIEKIELGKIKRSSYLPDIFRVLHLDLKLLTYQKGNATHSFSYSRSSASGSSSPTPRVVTRDLVGDRDLPVFAATRGGTGEMIVSTDVIEYVKRPTELEGVRNGYAIRIVGDSMAKAYRDGDMALVHPHLPPHSDEVHVFYDHDPWTGEAESMIKNLLGWNEETWRLEQFNPDRKFAVDRADWPICHRVVGKYNRR